MIIRCISSQSTGFKDTDIPICIASYDFDHHTLEHGNALSTFVDPEMPISPSATKASSGIRNQEVVGAPKVDEALAMFAGADIYVAHNAEFHQRIIGNFNADWICTAKLSRKLFPKLGSAPREAVRANFPLPTPDLGEGAHWATQDHAMFTLQFFKYLRWMHNLMLEDCILQQCSVSRS